MSQETPAKVPLPKKLRHLFDEHGHVTIKQFGSVTGLSYTYLLTECKRNGLGVNLGTPQKAIWRIFEEDAVLWFAKRRRTSIPEPADEPEPVSFYDDNGDWIPPEQR